MKRIRDGTYRRVANLTGRDLYFVSGDDSDDRAWHLFVEGDARIVGNRPIVEYVNYNGFRVPVLDVGGRRAANVPDKEDGVLLITSSLVANHLKRADVVSPGNVIRRGVNGQVVAARALLRFGNG